MIAVYEKQGDGSSATRVLAARYSDDPYGNPLSITNGSGTEVSQTSNTIAAINPFRYRGYRYAGETGLYYLQSRYYDPVTCRFVNADKYASTGYGIAGCNMFAYCYNSPLNLSDSEGELVVIDDAAILLAAFVGVAVVSIVNTPTVRETICNIGNSLSDILMDVIYGDVQVAIAGTIEYKEHTKGARNSTKGKHEEGQSRRQRDSGGEKGDSRRQSRNNKRGRIKKFTVDVPY